MTFAERLEADYRVAMKSGERIRIETLRLLKAGLQHAAIDKRKDALEDQEVIQVLSQQAKQCRETIAAATQGHRQDILDQATEELAIINSYLPQPLSEAAISQLIEEAIRTVGPSQGPVMKYVMGKAAGAADGKLVSRLAGECLRKHSDVSRG